MSLVRHACSYRVMDAAELRAWETIPTAVAGDAQNRSGCMAAAIQPVKPGLRLVGQARTVEAMVGDNSAAHAALALVRAGEVLVIDGRGHVDTALWGGIMTIAAIERRLAGVVIDGAVRDIAELRESGLPLFARGIVPRGPHKGFGGAIDGPVSVGGVAVHPGDLILGDDDGVTVVPLANVAQVLADAQKILAREDGMVKALRAGKSSAELVGVAVPDPTPR
jgi:4-hydroxy-4-methyl-2-oxoglutarate aldolase